MLQVLKLWTVLGFLAVALALIAWSLCWIVPCFTIGIQISLLSLCPCTKEKLPSLQLFSFSTFHLRLEMAKKISCQFKNGFPQTTLSNACVFLLLVCISKCIVCDSKCARKKCCYSFAMTNWNVRAFHAITYWGTQTLAIKWIPDLSI